MLTHALVILDINSMQSILLYLHIYKYIYTFVVKVEKALENEKFS